MRYEYLLQQVLTSKIREYNSTDNRPDSGNSRLTKFLEWPLIMPEGGFL